MIPRLRHERNGLLLPHIAGTMFPEQATVTDVLDSANQSGDGLRKCRTTALFGWSPVHLK